VFLLSFDVGRETLSAQRPTLHHFVNTLLVNTLFVNTLRLANSDDADNTADSYPENHPDKQEKLVFYASLHICLSGISLSGNRCSHQHGARLTNRITI
jgi:hypothetical protein